MSILIKGIEMPKSCDVCDFVYDLNEGDLGTHNYCGFPGIGVYVDDCIATRHKDCPLSEVKTPHGDLIDKGYAIATACSGLIRTLPTTEGGENWIRVTEVRESIKSAPTIIEAEE